MSWVRLYIGSKIPTMIKTIIPPIKTIKIGSIKVVIFCTLLSMSLSRTSAVLVIIAGTESELSPAAIIPKTIDVRTLEPSKASDILLPSLIFCVADLTSSEKILMFNKTYHYL